MTRERGTAALEAPHRRRRASLRARVQNVLLLRFWRAASWLLGHLPGRPAYVVGGWLALAGYAISPARRRWIRSNFGHVLGVPATDRRAGRLARAGYRNYIRYVIEIMRLPWLEARGRAPQVEAGGIERGTALWRASRGIVLVAPHMGNNDAAASGLASAGLPVSIVGDDSSFEGLYDLLSRQRERSGLRMIPWRNLRAMYGVLKRGEILGLLVDWGYRPDGIPVRLFGSWTTLPAGPAVLAARHGSTILPVAVTRTGEMRFRLEVGEPIEVERDDPGELRRATQAIADQLERWIAAAPEQWYIFKPIWPDDPAESARLEALAREPAEASAVASRRPRVPTAGPSGPVVTGASAAEGAKVTG